MPTTLITDSAHYTSVLDLAMKAKHSLWIGTADIKDIEYNYQQQIYEKQLLTPLR